MTAIITLVIMILLNWLVIHQKNPFLYLILVVPNIVYGLDIASDSAVKSPLWMAGVTVAVIGTFFLFRVAVAEVIPMMKRMRNK